jgi:hypothetical protein
MAVLFLRGWGGDLLLVFGHFVVKLSLPRGRSFLLLAQKKQNQRKRHPTAIISLFSGVRELAMLRQRTH